jgi:hypothetical protein
MKPSPPLPPRSVASGNTNHGGSQRMSREVMSLAGSSAGPAHVVTRPINHQPQSQSTRSNLSQRQLWPAEPPARATDRSGGRHNNPHRRSPLALAEWARGISPRAAHRSGLDTLASSGSCHQPKAAASRRELELLLLPVGSLPTSVTCPLCSTGITPLHHYYGAVRPWPAHQYFRPHGWAACAFSLRIADQVLKFHARAQMRVTPPIHRTPYGQ